RGRPAGSIGHIGCFSFYPSKNLGACGEGGAVVTGDSAIANTVRRLRDWGQDGKDNQVLKGYNYRMDANQGAVLGGKRRQRARWTDMRRSHARRYDDRLGKQGWQLPPMLPERRHVYHVYAPLVPDRAALQRRMSAAAIGTSMHYPKPIHLQSAFS